jgi:hypothetical protein
MPPIFLVRPSPEFELISAAFTYSLISMND